MFISRVLFIRQRFRNELAKQVPRKIVQCNCDSVCYSENMISKVHCDDLAIELIGNKEYSSREFTPKSHCNGFVLKTTKKQSERS